MDDDFAARGMENIGAWIMGRNMFGPIRGSWSDDEWKGWWGEEPPYHVPVFVLTHHDRPSFEMEGGTTFHFVTDGIHEALDRAREAADDKDVRIGGGPNTIRQYLREELIDELHVAIAPVLLGRGEPLFEDLDLRGLGYECVEFVGTEMATHVVITRTEDRYGAGSNRRAMFFSQDQAPRLNVLKPVRRRRKLRGCRYRQIRNGYRCKICAPYSARQSSHH